MPVSEIRCDALSVFYSGFHGFNLSEKMLIISHQIENVHVDEIE